MIQNGNIELYIHIPFCVRKCNYCDFLSGRYDEETKQAYVEALVSQIQKECSSIFKNENECKASSIYFGGGTPSVLNIDSLKKIIDAISENVLTTKDCEYTIEVNPGTVDLCKLKSLRELGFNRISIGMQSADDEELRMLGRIHTWDDFYECYVNSREAGFTNINVDVMTALEGQDTDKLDRTLNKVIELNPEHISAYSLIVEEGTPFYAKYKDCDGPVVGENMERKLYWHCVHKLEEAGYTHYEISNFAKDGFYSRHNSGYWTGVHYLGIGLGASSYIPLELYKSISNNALEIEQDDVKLLRIDNTSSMEDYLDDSSLKEQCTLLTRENEIEEFMFLGLRMMRGVSKSDFYASFSKNIHDYFGDVINDLMKEELLVETEDRIFLTDKGIDYGNYVFSQFLLS